MPRRYYYDTGTEKIGPVSGEELLRLRAEGTLSDDTWVRREDNGTWRPLRTVDLRREEEAAANPSLWSLLLRSGLLGPLVLLALGAVVFLLLAAGVVRVFWPLLLVIFIVWLFGKALR